MKEYILIFLSLIFADNILFKKMLGLEFALVLRKEKALTPIFWASSVVLTALMSVGAWYFEINSFDQLVCAALFIIVAVIFGAIFDLSFSKTKASRTFAVALSMNTAILGLVFSMSSVDSLSKALVIGLSHGVGLMLSSVLMNCIEENVRFARPPKFLGKALLTLVCVAIVAMAFSAFDGFALRYENINS